MSKRCLLLGTFISLAMISNLKAAPVTGKDPIPIGTGENILAAANWNHDRGASSDLTLILRLDIDGETVADEGHEVKYLINNAADEGPEDWVERDFDDSDWEDGEASVGYGDGDDWTITPAGAASVFTRYRFQLKNADAVKKIDLFVDWDDFYLITINGVEVARDSNINAQVPQPDIPAGNVNLHGGHGASELARKKPNTNRWDHGKIDRVENIDFEVSRFAFVKPNDKLATVWGSIKMDR